MATNFKDPRFQRALIRSGSAPREKQRGLVSRLTSDFTEQQTRKQLAFDRIADSQTAFNANLGLRRRQLSFETGLAKDKLRSEKKGLTITTVAGIGTGILGYMQGKRRATLLAEEAREERINRLQMRNDITAQQRFAEYGRYSSEF